MDKKNDKHEEIIEGCVTIDCTSVKQQDKWTRILTLLLNGN